MSWTVKGFGICDVNESIFNTKTEARKIYKKALAETKLKADAYEYSLKETEEKRFMSFQMEGIGMYSACVLYKTPENRVDRLGILCDELEFQIAEYECTLQNSPEIKDTVKKIRKEFKIKERKDDRR